MKQKKVVIADQFSQEQIDAFIKTLPADIFKIDIAAQDSPALAERVKDANALVMWKSDITAKIIEDASQLQLIVRLGTAKGSLDTKVAEQRGISVKATPSPALVSVAEHTLLLMMALTKELIPAHQSVKAGEYPASMTPILTTQTEMAYNWIGLERFDALYRKTVGLVGCGAIGQEVARRARAFEMDVLYTKRNRLPSALEQELGATYTELDTLLKRSDFVSLHLKYYDRVEKMIAGREFSLMKKNAFFINTSRGRLVDEKALYLALKEKEIAGAGLDVFEYEPLPKDNPLLQLNNVILTPHCAGIPLSRSLVTELEQAAYFVSELN